MISDEAVDAALKAHLAHKSVRSPDNAKSAMRAALEAAAPHMLGECEAEGLEDAAGAYPTCGPNKTGPHPSDWLRERANLIRKGTHP